MKRSIEYPEYRLTNDGRVLKNGKEVPTYVALNSINKRSSVNYKEFIKLFNIESDEPDDSIEVDKPTVTNGEEQWYNTERFDWVEVSTFGRFKVNGIIQKEYIINDHKVTYVYHPKTREAYSFYSWKEVIKIKYPGYDSRKCIFLDGDRMNCKIENLEDWRDARYFVSKGRRENGKGREIQIKQEIEEQNSKKITITLEEFNAMREFNDKMIKELEEIKKKNERVKHKYRLVNDL